MGLYLLISLSIFRCLLVNEEVCRRLRAPVTLPARIVTEGDDSIFEFTEKAFVVALRSHLENCGLFYPKLGEGLSYEEKGRLLLNVLKWDIYTLQDAASQPEIFNKIMNHLLQFFEEAIYKERHSLALQDERWNWDTRKRVLIFAMDTFYPRLTPEMQREWRKKFRELDRLEYKHALDKLIETVKEEGFEEVKIWTLPCKGYNVVIISARNPLTGKSKKIKTVIYKRAYSDFLPRLMDIDVTH